MANAQTISPYFTCFICYGQPDLTFATRLVAELRAKGVSCWIYAEDATPGAKTQKEIIQQRSIAEKVIALCSYRSLIQDGVLSEIDDQIREDPDKLIPISLDAVWHHPGFRVMWSSRDLKPFLLERNYADFSDESTYAASLARLLAALERSRKDRPTLPEPTHAAVSPRSGPERGAAARPPVDNSALERRVAGIAELLRLRGDAKDLSFVPQILDELATVFILKYRLLPTEELDEPRVYLKLVKFLQTDLLPFRRFVGDLKAQGWEDITILRGYFAETSAAINREDKSPPIVARVQHRLSRLYTLLKGLVAEETNERAAEAKMHIALSHQESDYIEYKATLRYNLATKQIDKQMEFEVVKTIAGLANHRGGTLYIGVNDNAEIVGTDADLSTFPGPNPIDHFRRHFDQLVDNSFGVENYQLVEPEWAEPEGKKVFVVKIKPGSTPTFVRTGNDGDFYVRRGARTVKLGPQRFFEYHRARWSGEPPAAAALEGRA